MQSADGSFVRGFDVLKQNVCLSVDLELERIVGLSELTVKPISKSINTIYLHSRQCNIKTITINGIKSEFRLLDLVSTVATTTTSVDLNVYSVYYVGSLEASEQGELHITIPSSIIKLMQEVSVLPTLTVSIEYEMQNPQGTVHFVNGHSSSEETQKLNTKSLSNKRMKKQFDRTQKFNHMYVHHNIFTGDKIGGCCGARCWFPCVDTLTSRMPLELTVTVAADLTAISSGELVDVLLSSDETVKIFKYIHDEPIAPHNVGLVVGPFDIYVHPTMPWITLCCLPGRMEDLKVSCKGIARIIRETQEYLSIKFPYSSYKQVYIDGNSAYEEMSCYSTLTVLSDTLLSDGKLMEQQVHLRRCLMKGIAYNYFGSLVHIKKTSDVWLLLGLIGILECVCIRKIYGELTLREILQDVLKLIIKSERNSEKVKKYRTTSGDFSSVSLRQPNPADTPVDATLWEANCLSLDSFMYQRALYVVHILEQKTTPEMFQKVCRDVVFSAVQNFSKISHLHPNAKIVQSPTRLQRISSVSSLDPGVPTRQSSFRVLTPNQGNEPFDGLTELKFLSKLKAANAVQNMDINRKFTSQWIEHRGFPSIKLTSYYMKRSNVVEINVKQLVPHGVAKFQGMIKIRVVEVDGAWDYEKPVEELTHRWNIPIHSQYHKKKGGRKRKVDIQREEQWLHPEKLDTKDLLTLATGTSKNNKRRRWWDNDTPVKYVVLDPDLSWIRDIVSVSQDEVMSLELLNDGELARNVSPQIDTLKALAQLPPKMPAANSGDTSSNPGVDKSVGTSLRAASAIAAVMVDFSKSPMIRAEACKALLKWQTLRAPNKAKGVATSGTWAGLNLMIQCIRKLFYDSKTGQLLPNDFGVNGEAVLKPVAFKCICNIRAQNGEAPDEVIDMVLDFLRYNDNSVNAFDDSLYISKIVKYTSKLVVAIATTTPVDEIGDVDKFLFREDGDRLKDPNPAHAFGNEPGEMLQHIYRLLEYDIIAPSPRYVVTGGCLKALGEVEAGGILPPFYSPFFAFAVGPIDESELHDVLSGIPSVLRNKTSHQPEEIASLLKTDFGYNVQFAAYKSMIYCYLVARIATGHVWMDLLKWILVSVSNAESPLLKRMVFKELLNQYSNSVNIKFAALENHTSPSGCFWPLYNTLVDMSAHEASVAKEIILLLWELLNQDTAYDARLRMIVYQLWRNIFEFHVPPMLADNVYESVNLGPYTHWVDNGESNSNNYSVENHNTKSALGTYSNSNNKRVMSQQNSGPNKIRITDIRSNTKGNSQLK